MNRYTVAIAPAAESDIANAFAWYKERNRLAADAFRDEVFDTVERIGRAPLSHAADDEGNRRRVVRHFPFSIIYEVRANVVTILAVAHHRRYPGYWRGSAG